MFRIGLSGTNWTGKTETIRRFMNENPELRIKPVFLSSLVARCPFPMGREQTLEGSRWMIEQVADICNKAGRGIQLYDRSPVDILAFTVYAEDQTDKKDSSIIKSALDLVRYFDILFYLPTSNEWPVNMSLEDDTIRFARQIDTYIRRAIDEFAPQVISLPWDLDEREHLLSQYVSGLKTTERMDHEAVQKVRIPIPLFARSRCGR